MKRLWRVVFSGMLVMVMLATVLSLTAFAAEDTKSREEITLNKLLKTGVFVEENKKAGLRWTVNMSPDYKNAGGVVYLPGSAQPSKLTLSWSNQKVTFEKDGTTYKSGKAPLPKAGKSVTYTVSKGKLSAPLTIRTLKGSTEVEPLYLEIDESKGSIAKMNLDLDHETKCYGKLKVGDHKKKYVSMKGRGSSTWLMPKKPYNITIYDDDTYTTKDKTELIEGVKKKKWSLLANYFDNSLLRNKIAYDLANQMGIGLESKFVDVWMNGDYLGNYLLTPKKDSYCSDDGFIIENDHNLPEGETGDHFDFPNIHEMPGKHNYLLVDDIGDNAKAAGVNAKTIEKWFTKAWNAVLDKDTEDYQKYFDITSWAKMYLMFEVSKTYDCYSGNIIMHRDGMTAKDKLYAGPAWDYDIAFGRTLHKFLVGVSEPVQLNAEGWYNDSIGYFVTGDEPVSILQELGKHASFMREVQRVFQEYRWAFEGIDGNIAKQAGLIRKSANMNNARHGTQSPGAYYMVAPNTMSAIGTGKYKLNYKVTTDWDAYIYNLREYSTKRVLWLSDHLQPGQDITTYHGGTVSTK